MFARWPLFVALTVLLPATAPQLGEARVVRFVIQQTRPLAGGQVFGDAGPYQRLDGTVYLEVDPRDPLNAVIVNLDKAPRNDKGLVEFSAQFYILKPVDMARSNRKIFYGINNRGNSIELARFNLVAPGTDASDPANAAGVGDGFLMKLGYMIVDAGWQGDLAPGNARLVPNLPFARQPDGSPIVARVRVEFSDRMIPQVRIFTLPLKGAAAFRSYEAADTNTARSTLTVRDSVSGPRTPIPSDRWAFGQCPRGRESLVPGALDICLFDGFRADKLYELIYPAKNPIVMGLGHAVTRDLASFLRYESRDASGNLNPLASSTGQLDIRRVYATGSSQTGIYLRDLLYLGFNEDESHRKVLDAVNINISGTLRNFINVEFADPNAYSAQADGHDYLMTSYSPLTYAVTTDPISGLRTGILSRPATDPLVIDTHTETEYFQLRASLNLTDGLGQPALLPNNVRMYLLSGLQHGSLTWVAPLAGPRGLCQNATNGVPGAPTARALLMAMDAWADGGIEPPKSRVPDVRDGTLVSLEETAKAFPAIPGVRFPPSLNRLELLNFGPEFGPLGGRITLLPPLAGPSYQVLVPRPDADGIDIAGIRVVETAVPLGTATGWNVRAAGFREGNLCGLSGSYIPFAATRAERMATGDPRPSLEERYKDHAGYIKAIEAATRKLTLERFLLSEDAERYVREARASVVLRQPSR